MMSTMVGKEEESILQFAPFQSAVDEGFWLRLSSLKLNRLGNNEFPIPITGFYAPCSNNQVSNHLTLLAESLPPEASEPPLMPAISRGNRNRCPIPGTLYNTNTLEGFWALDKQALLEVEARKIWEGICSGEVEKDCSALSRFLVISFADLKKWSFYYWFAFPALTLDPPASVVNLKPAMQWFSVEEAESVTAACNDWRNMCSTTDVPFFLVSISSNSAATVRHLAEFEACQLDGHKVLFGFYDPCHLPNNPGWPLQNLLWFICRTWSLQKVQFFCYRESLEFADLELTLVGEALIPNSQELNNLHEMPSAVGWDLNSGGSEASRCISLAKTMDPTRLSIEAANLNSRLIRWRHLPSLNMDLLSSTRCLLLGAGTLGCQVARMLMAWGVRKITLLDSGKLSMSNPLRQSLYTLDDCLNGGRFKAIAAVKSLSRIFPAVEAESVVMTVPILGHPVPSLEENNVLEDCRHLQDLINSHDAVFLLTDTAESRWLPTVFCAQANKITISADIGFDSFLVMRHGAGPQSSSYDMKTEAVIDLCTRFGKHSLLDYCRGHSCNHMFAPKDSTSTRTLDQQCSVTRPGVAPIASSLAVELLVGILHHPFGISAKADFASSSRTTRIPSLDILPHQIIGSLLQYSLTTPSNQASINCLACSSNVVREYEKRGLAFILEAINYPKHLEDISGLSEWNVMVYSDEVDVFV